MQSMAYPLSVLRNILVNTRINILQWILTKLGTYLVVKRIWNPIDFQGQGHWVKFLFLFLAESAKIAEKKNLLKKKFTHKNFPPIKLTAIK
jgi:translation initiation factor 2 beta subunit (eIF-2beta)/eIF-5